MAGSVARGAKVVHNDFRAAPRQVASVGTAYAAARAGDDGDLTFEADGHG
jgi:hypothetical protein